MAYHTREVHGPMRQTTIATVIKTPQDFEAHDAKVNAFNEAHNVFFNTTMTCDRTEQTFRLLTVCLYADGGQK